MNNTRFHPTLSEEFTRKTIQDIKDGKLTEEEVVEKIREESDRVIIEKIIEAAKNDPTSE